MAEGMRVTLHCSATGLAVAFKVGGIMTTPDGAVYVDGTDKDGNLVTVSVSGVDNDGRSLVQLLSEEDDG